MSAGELVPKVCFKPSYRFSVTRRMSALTPERSALKCFSKPFTVDGKVKWCGYLNSVSDDSTDAVLIGNVLATIAEMERATPISELEAFYLARNLRYKINEPDPRHFTAEHRRQVALQPCYPGNNTTSLASQSAIVAAGWADRQKFGLPMHPWHLDRLADKLAEAGTPACAVRLKMAASAHMGKLYRMIDNRNADAKLNGLQASVPRLRINVEGVNSPDTESDGSVNFRTICEECGSLEIDFPDGDEPLGPTVCRDCGHVFGTRKAALKLASYVAEMVGLKVLI